jgi:putative membrane protein
MFGIIISFIAGIAAGTFTGLIPGIHINLIAISVLSFSLLSNLSPINLITFIIAMATTHTFLDFIPSIFLGAPDEDTCLGILPGHQFLIKGLGYHAIKLTLIGSSIATASLILIIPFFILALPKLYPLIERMMGFLLIWAAIFLVSNEKSKMKSVLIFLLAGFLGFSTFNLNLSQPLLPMLTGLFGASTIIQSIKNESSVPEQNLGKMTLDKKEIIKPTLATIIISPICSLLPGLGASQAAVISSKIFKKSSQEQFLILLGSINTLVMSTSFITLYLFQKTRTGAAAAISQIIQISPEILVTIITIIILSTIISIPLALLISRTIAKHIHKIPYKMISIGILTFLVLVTFHFTGFLGLLVLGVSTGLGITCTQLGTKKGLLMGSILIPTIIFYLPF